MKKIAIILGRGVEGCGVTRCAVEFQKATPNTKIFATLDKKWARRDTMVFDKDEFTCGKSEEMTRVLDEVNENFDMVLVYSVPSKKHPEDCQINFVKLVQGITLPKAIVQLDHKMQSLSRNGKFDEICNSVDVLMTHSLESDFTRWAKRENVNTPFKKMALGFTYDDHREKYWLPIDEQDHKTVRWIGRLSGWKGPNLMMDFHAQQLMEENYITILEGLEASIGWAGILYEKGDNKNGKPFYKDHEIVNHFRPRKELNEVKFTEDLHGKETPGSGSYLYPPYTNVDCMERMAKSAFGSDLYHLKAHMYGNNIENCHAEVVASGTIPIFHKHFCDNVIHRITGNPVTKDSHSGTIGLDHTNFEETKKLMVKLSNDPVMRDEWREMAFTYWKKHSNADICTNEIITNLENIIIENGKIGAQASSNAIVDDNQLSIFDEIEDTPEVKEKPKETTQDELRKTDNDSADYESLMNQLKNI
jgi:hypothetical protein